MKLFALFLGLLAGLAGDEPVSILKDPRPMTHRAVCAPAPLDPNTPEDKRIGRLLFVSGCAVQSDSIRVSGLSALAYDRETNQLFALNDGGVWVIMTPVFRGDRLSGFLNVRSRPFSDPDIRPKPGQQGVADSEGLALLPDRSALAVSFEDLQTIRFYSVPKGRSDFPERLSRPLALPSDLARQRINGGIEALTVLADGRLLAFAETPPGYESLNPVWIAGPDGFERMNYVPRDGFQPTGADTLMNGDIILTTRRFSFLDGFSVRIERIRAASLRPGAAIEGEILAELRPPLTVDNYESVAILSETPEKIRFMIASDDNRSVFQRTLFLVFDLKK